MGGLLHLAYAAAVRSDEGVTRVGCVRPTAAPTVAPRRGRGPTLRQGAPLRRRPAGGSTQGRRPV